MLNQLLPQHTLARETVLCPIPADTAERVAALQHFRVLDFEVDPAFDRITKQLTQGWDCAWFALRLDHKPRQCAAHENRFFQVMAEEVMEAINAQYLARNRPISTGAMNKRWAGNGFTSNIP